MLLWPAAAWAVMAAAGYLPTRWLCGDGGVEAMLAAQGVVGAIVYVTLLPTARRMAAADTAGRLRLGLRASAFRLIATMAVIGAIVLREMVKPAPFLVWAAISYVVMIKVETLVLILWNRRLEKP